MKTIKATTIVATTKNAIMSYFRFWFSSKSSVYGLAIEERLTKNLVKVKFNILSRTQIEKLKLVLGIRKVWAHLPVGYASFRLRCILAWNSKQSFFGSTSGSNFFFSILTIQSDSSAFSAEILFAGFSTNILSTRSIATGGMKDAKMSRSTRGRQVFSDIVL